MSRSFFVKQVKRLLLHDFMRHNLIFFVGTLAISIFNYVYYPVIGRMVSVSDFGEIQAAISIFMQLGIILTAFGYVVTNIINNTKEHEKSVALIIRLEQLTLLLCIVVFGALCFFSLVLKNSLQFTSVVPFIMVGFLVVLNVLSTSRMYFLQGLRRLKEVSIAGIIFSIGKLCISIMLISVINSVSAAMAGYVVALIITLAYLLKKTKNIFPSLRYSLSFDAKTAASEKRKVRDEVVYGIAILVLLSGVTLLYSSDSVVIRLFFSPNEAGMYSAVSAVARIIFFITASVAGVLLATVRMRDGRQKNMLLLRKSFGLVTLIGGTVTLFFVLFPKFSTSVLFGTKYIGAAHLLPMLALLMLLCSYNNLLVCYEIALRRFRAILIVAASVVILILMIWLLHDSLAHIIFNYLVVNVFVLVLLSIHILRRRDHVETTAIRRSPEL